MKLIVLAVIALAAVALAAPVDPKPVEILRSVFEQQPEGAYNFGFETEDGSKRDEAGEVKLVNDEDNKPQPVLVVRGSYSFVDGDNKPHVVNYYADETGYHADSADLPQTNLA